MNEDRTVLEEDDYVAKLAKVIRRHFLPHRKLVKQQLRLLNNEQHFEPNEDSDDDEECLSLNEFCEKYTSEDNASFTSIMEKMSSQHQQRMERRYGLKAIEPSTKKDTLAIENSKSIANSNKHLNQLMFYPTTDMAPATDKKSTNQSKLIYSNTRFGPESDHLSRENSSVRWDLDASSQTALYSTLRKYGHFVKDKSVKEFQQLLDTPTNKLMSNSQYVHTPIIEPGASRSDDNDLMTWGTVDSTPLQIEDGPHFRVPQVSKREQLSMKLASKAANNMCRSAGYTPSPMRTPNSTPTPGMTKQQRLNALSPAAQRLAQNLRKQRHSHRDSKQNITDSPMTKRKNRFDSTQAKKKHKIE